MQQHNCCQVLRCVAKGLILVVDPHPFLGFNPLRLYKASIALKAPIIRRSVLQKPLLTSSKESQFECWMCCPIITLVQAPSSIFKAAYVWIWSPLIARSWIYVKGCTWSASVSVLAWAGSSLSSTSSTWPELSFLFLRFCFLAASSTSMSTGKSLDPFNWSSDNVRMLCVVLAWLKPDVTHWSTKKMTT